MSTDVQPMFAPVQNTGNVASDELILALDETFGALSLPHSTRLGAPPAATASLANIYRQA